MQQLHGFFAMAQLLVYNWRLRALFAHAELFLFRKAKRRHVVVFVQSFLSVTRWRNKREMTVGSRNRLFIIVVGTQSRQSVRQRTLDINNDDSKKTKRDRRSRGEQSTCAMTQLRRCQHLTLITLIVNQQSPHQHQLFSPTRCSCLLFFTLSTVCRVLPPRVN